MINIDYSYSKVYDIYIMHNTVWLQIFVVENFRKFRDCKVIMKYYLRNFRFN